MEDRDQNSLLGQIVQLSTGADTFPTGSFYVLTNLGLKIPNNEDFITLPIYSDYSFHKLYPKTFLLFAIFYFFVLVANTILLLIPYIIMILAGNRLCEL